MNKVLIFGGLGFLGRAVTNQLLEDGYDVTIFDQNSENKTFKDVNIISGNILDKELVDKEISKVNIVFHMAGIADIEEADKNPSETIQSNIIGSTIIIEACAKYSVKIMFASTVYVYSRYGSFYRVTKQSIELILEEYSRKYNLVYTILRYGSLYGPNAQNWNRVKSSILKMINNKKIVVSGTGNEKREFIHVNDAAKLSIISIDDKYKNKAVSITGTQVLSQSELLEIIKEILSDDIKIEYDYATRRRDHYQLTPYQYTPKHATKLISNEYIDIGQGILEIIEEIHNNQ